MSRYAIGMDFGTLSGRAVLVDVADGRMVVERAMDYPHAVMDTALPSGKPLGKDWALQHPQDYLDVMDALLPALTAQVDPAEIVAVGVDVTSATAMPVDRDFTPLCLKDPWQDDPYAYAMMWKHHACHQQAQRMTEVAVARGEKWLPLYGGKINVEWYFPKLLQILEERPEVYHAMDQYVEAVEWLVWQLTGSYVRSEGCVGYKALYAGAYPSEAYFAAVNPDFRHVVGTKHRGPIGKLGSCAGRVTQTAADRWGLAPGTPVAVGNIDAHVCMPASGITAPGSMLAIIGTSTVTLLVGNALQAAPGICGAVQDGVLPGFAGYEAGQSCVGDSFRWYEKNAVPAYITDAAAREGIGVQAYLTRLAEKLRPGESGLIALDWFNAADPAGGDLPRADRVHRLRMPRHRGQLPRARRGGGGLLRQRRHLPEERHGHADLRRRAEHARPRGGRGAGSCAGQRHLRRGGGGRVSHGGGGHPRHVQPRGEGLRVQWRQHCHL